MRNLKLVDAVIQLHDIARLVLEETEDRVLSDALRKCADRLHVYSINDDRANAIAQELINQVKK
jgi:hypothetical protein